MIKEIVVVEGRNDASAVKRAVEAEVIITGGFGITPDTVELIRKAKEKRGVIIFTDPDYAGERIRDFISREVPGCRHAFLPRHKAVNKNGKIGIEYASTSDIKKALENVRVQDVSGEYQIFTMVDLMRAGLVGTGEASIKRQKLGEALGIGHGSAKKILQRLNGYQITREEFNKALQKIGEGR